MTDWMARAHKRIKRTLWISYPLIFIGITLPFIALFFPFRPCGENLETWFQRSGAIMILIVVWLEVLTHSIDGYLYPSGMSTSNNRELKEIYKLYYNTVRIFTVILAIFGTLIWGYGDLLL